MRYDHCAVCYFEGTLTGVYCVCLHADYSLTVQKLINVYCVCMHANIYTVQDGAAQMMMEFNVNTLCPLVGQVLGFNAVFRPRYETLCTTSTTTGCITHATSSFSASCQHISYAFDDGQAYQTARRAQALSQRDLLTYCALQGVSYDAAVSAETHAVVSEIAVLIHHCLRLLHYIQLMYRDDQDRGSITDTSNSSSSSGAAEVRVSSIWPDIVVRGSAASCRINTEQVQYLKLQPTLF
jgi:hypothetical protein